MNPNKGRWHEPRCVCEYCKDADREKNATTPPTTEEPRLSERASDGERRIGDEELHEVARRAMGNPATVDYRLARDLIDARAEIAKLRAVADAVNGCDVQRDPRHRVSMLVNDWQRIDDALAAAIAAAALATPPTEESRDE